MRSPIRSTRSSRLRVIAAAAVAALAGVTTLMATAGSNPTPVASAVSGTLSLGGTIFDDVNNDHHSTGDQGLNNVTVSLYNSDGQPGGHATVPQNGLPLATTSTANGGQYAFANIVAGSYYIEFSPPAGYVSSTDHDAVSTETTNPDTDPDGDDHGLTGVSVSGGAAAVTTVSNVPNYTGIQLSADRTDLDFGVFQAASMGDLVWSDVNNDGVKDANESGVAGASVCIFDGLADPLTAAPLAQKSTDTNGKFSFGFLGNNPNGFRMIVTKGSPFVNATSSAAPISPPDGVDNDDNGIVENNNRIATGVIMVTSGQQRTDIDFGVVASFNPTSATTTAATTSTTTAPTSSTTTAPTSSTTTAPTSSTTAGPTSSTTSATTAPTSATTAPTTIAGSNSIGDRIWNDINNNGIDDGEPGFAQVQASLMADANTDGIPDASTRLYASITDGSGHFQITNVPDGSYVVAVDGLGTGFLSSTGAVALSSGPFEPGKSQSGGVDGQDHGKANTGDASFGQFWSGTVTVNGGTVDNTIDFGMYLPSVIGSRVWNDQNNDGLDNNGEPGMTGITVCLFDSNGLLDTQITGGDGGYLFHYLVPGTYKIVLVKSSFPANFVASASAATSADPNNHVDQDNNGVIDSGSTIDAGWLTLGADSPNPHADYTVDFGLRNVTVVVSTTSSTTSTSSSTTISVGPGGGSGGGGGGGGGDSTTVPSSTEVTSSTKPTESTEATTSTKPTQSTEASSSTNPQSTEVTSSTQGSTESTLVTGESSSTLASKPKTDQEVTATVPVTTKVELGAGPASSTSTSSTTTVESSGPRPSTAGTDAPTTTRDAVSPAATIAPPNSSPVSSAPATTVAAPSTACQSLWVDLDGNGKQDAGEDALASVTVELTDPGLDGAFGNADDVKVTATTDATGQYCVTMAQGVYRMRIISGLPAKYSVLAKQSFKVKVKGLEISRAADGATFGAEGSSAAAAPSGAPVDNLPFTGSQSSRQIVLALAALAFGVSLFLVTRRRGRHTRQM